MVCVLLGVLVQVVLVQVALALEVLAQVVVAWEFEEVGWDLSVAGQEAEVLGLSEVV